MRVEILYLAWNRLAFTKASFELLKRNTHWNLVDRLVVYDDGSTDGTAQYLQKAGTQVGVPAFEFREVNFGAPGATMNDFLALTDAETFVKVDNDIAVPRGWLPRMINLAKKYPEYDLIGMEAGQNSAPPRRRSPEYSLKPARHIGGVGLMRTECFRRRMPIPASLGRSSSSRTRDGFTIWQYRNHPVAAWTVPDLAVVQLDKIPEDPWLSLRQKYINEGWSRDWPLYELEGRDWWSWIGPQLMDVRL